MVAARSRFSAFWGSLEVRQRRPLVMMTAVVAGRHAFDADHISAIDNTTRKLMQEGKRPLSVGFWFSLGHSTIVFALALLISIGVRSLSGPVKAEHSSVHQATGLLGTAI